MPPDPSSAEPASFGAADAPLRCYAALSDAALASAGAAYRAALAIGAALGGDEVRVDVGGYDGRPLDPYSFVHAVGLDDPDAVLVELIGAAHPRGILTLLTPLFDDPCNGGYWGARAHTRALRVSDDEELLGGFLATLVARKLVLDECARTCRGARDRFSRRAAYGAVVRGRRVRSVRCGSAAHPVGLRKPIAPSGRTCRWRNRCRCATPPSRRTCWPSLRSDRCTRRRRWPARLPAPVCRCASPAPCRTVRTQLGRARISTTARAFAPGDPGRGARVVADVSWSGADLGALASHALHGVPVVASNRSDARDVFGTRGVWAVDPADEVAIAQALCEAWNGAADVAAPLAEHTRARCRVDVLRACLTAAYNAPQRVA